MLNLVLLVIIFAIAFVVYHLVVRALPVIRNSKCFSNTHSGSFVCPDGNAPSGELLSQPATVKLSIVVPAYNEENRIDAMLDETIGFLENRQKSDPSFKYEIVVVNDGSKDNTKDRVLAFTKKYGFEKCRLLNLDVNCGKGAAINKGMRHSRGEYILFADADGATKFEGITGVEKEMAKIKTKDNLGCVVGSRYLGKEEKVERTALRKFVSKTFHALVVFICGVNLEDTQCGFKMFTRETAQKVIPSQHVDRWAFDIEVLFLCSLFKVPCGEVPVTWFEIDGSKMTISGAAEMGRDILLIRLLYLLGVWTTKTKQG